MIQKKIKKWYPTKERENEDKRSVQNREVLSRLNEAAEVMNRISRNAGNYVVVGPDVARVLQDAERIVATTTTTEPREESATGSNTWQMFKEDFGEWKWSSFWSKLIIFSSLSLIFSICHRFMIGPIKLNNGSLCPFYLEVLFAQVLYLGMSSLFWVLEKLWYIKAYITGFIKLGITLLLILPLALVLSLITREKSKAKVMADKFNSFWADKCFTKKEGEIIEKYIKEV